MGCGGGAWVLALLSTEALIFYYKEKKIATATWRKERQKEIKIIDLDW
jgi:hypothetical protein